MFLRHQGKRFLLLRSYRDGRGKVCQERLWTFRDAAHLRRSLEPAAWEALRSEVGTQGDWARIRRQALELVPNIPQEPAEVRVRRIRRASEQLQSWLSEEEDPEVLRLLGPVLRLLREQLPDDDEETAEEWLEMGERLLEKGDLARAEETLQAARTMANQGLPADSRRFDPREGVTYLRVLDRLGEVLGRRGRHAEAAEVLAERVRRRPTPEARVAYGRALLLSNRPLEAADQFRRPLAKETARHYHEAVALLAAGDSRRALPVLLRGMARDRGVAQGVPGFGKPGRGRWYWEEFADLWSPASRKWLQAVCADGSVRMALAFLRRNPTRVRALLSPTRLGVVHARVTARIASGE